MSCGSSKCNKNFLRNVTDVSELASKTEFDRRILWKVTERLKLKLIKVTKCNKNVIFFEKGVAI